MGYLHQLLFNFSQKMLSFERNVQKNHRFRSHFNAFWCVVLKNAIREMGGYEADEEID